MIFGDIILIATVKPNKLQKINNHLEKVDIISFLQIVVDFLLHIWFTHGDQNNIGKNCQKSLISIFLKIHFVAWVQRTM